MRWAFKWKKELEPGADGTPGIYYCQLLPRGFIKPEDEEPPTTGLDFYIDAFRELSSCRPGGMGLQSIPFTAIVEYSRIYELDDFEEFAYLMRLMDNLFIELYAADQARGNNANANADKKNYDKR